MKEEKNDAGSRQANTRERQRLTLMRQDGKNNYKRVKQYFFQKKGSCDVYGVGTALGMSIPTARKWLTAVREDWQDFTDIHGFDHDFSYGIAGDKPAETIDERMAELEDKVSQIPGLVGDSFIKGSKSLVSKLSQLVEKQIAESESRIRESVSKTIEIHVPERKEPRKLEGQHDSMELALRVAGVLPNIWLCGPSGTGKTTIARNISKAFDLPFGMISCTTGMSEAQVGGRITLNHEYLEAPFIHIYENGGVFLFDEFDGADSNVLLFINAALSDIGFMPVPNRRNKPLAERHKDTLIVVATNTWGMGADTQFAGREPIDAATRDRFALSKIYVGYSKALESALINEDLGEYETATGWKCTKDLKNTLGQIFLDIRKSIQTHDLRRELSTRVFGQAALLLQAGFNRKEIIERYFVDWTEWERNKVVADALK